MPYSAMHTDTRERRPMAKFAKLKWIASPALVAAGIFFLALSAISQNTPEKPAPSHEDGIPVTDQLVVSKCSGCHQADAKGNLSRISNIRTTPEGWEEAIKRMIRLNGLVLSPDEARQVLRYLSNSHGLAPEKLRRSATTPSAAWSTRNLPTLIFAMPAVPAMPSPGRSPGAAVPTTGRSWSTPTSPSSHRSSSPPFNGRRAAGSRRHPNPLWIAVLRWIKPSSTSRRALPCTPPPGLPAAEHWRLA